MRKGESNVVLMVIIGIILAIILVFATKAFPEALFGILSRETTEDVHSENQFAVLADKLKIMDEGVRYEQLFGVGEGYVVTGFSKDKKGISAGRCGGKSGFEIRNEILKPSECEGRGCLCLCRGSLNDNYVCSVKENRWCYGGEFNITDNGNECGVFVIEGYDFGNLYMKKEKGVLWMSRAKEGLSDMQNILNLSDFLML
ncbi:MAG TPA: hypothetical protein VJH95_02015 [Candidatus Nanoarchaeia archaeon]|nr:hypothetical protein [Candidatus Nanoarchaeia archaeon]